MNISDAILAVKGILNNDTERRSILCFVLGKGAEFLIAHPEAEVGGEHFSRFSALCKRRAKGEPMAYLKGVKEFFGLDFFVDSRVLVPRPETEMVVEEVVKLLSAQAQMTTKRPDVRRGVLDIGTGSGCIAISLAKKCPNLQVTAVDISSGALEVAKKNAEAHGVSDRIEFVQCDLLENVMDKPFDGIVANLPYIGLNDGNVENGVRDFEPHEALFGGETGLELFEKLFAEVKSKKLNVKWLICEFGFKQKPSLAKMIGEFLPKSKVEWKKDLAGLDRAFVLWL